MKPYNPLSKEEQQKRADRIAQRYCISCDGDYETKCKSCVWYLIMNSMLEGKDQ